MLDLDENGGRPTRIGWITLPSFYANMENRGTPKSTTEDVALLIARLKREGIQGLVIDLRRDGGGSLEEAINLTGLFIPKGPVVQAKDSNGKITSRRTPILLAYSGRSCADQSPERFREQKFCRYAAGLQRAAIVVTAHLRQGTGKPF